MQTEHETLLRDLKAIDGSLASWARNEMNITGATPHEIRKRLKAAVKMVSAETPHDAIHAEHMRTFGA